MRSVKSVLFLLGAGAIAANAIIGCNGDDTRVGYDESEDAGSRAALPETGSPSPSPTDTTPTDDPPSTKDGGPSDADADAASDASDSSDGSGDTNRPAPDAGELMPPPDPDAGAPGSACPTKDAIQQQPCGLCGVQYRLCAPNDSQPGSPNVWQPWGFCQNELVGGCVPGTTATESCGLCGDRQKVCQNDCRWAAGACKNEPVNACSPGSEQFQAGLSCVEGGRKRVCQDTCTYGPYGECFVPGMPTITLGTTVGAKTTKQFTLSAEKKQPKLSGTCGGSTSLGSDTAYEYVKIVNPTASTAVVSVWSHTPAGGSLIDSVMAAYNPAIATPVSDTERKACTKGVTNCCSSDKAAGEADSTMCNGSSLCWAGLVGSKAITIAPNGTAIIYMAAYNGTSAGDFMLSARIDSLN